jgi:hypothetical protein
MNARTVLGYGLFKPQGCAQLQLFSTILFDDAQQLQ